MSRQTYRVLIYIKEASEIVAEMMSRAETSDDKAFWKGKLFEITRLIQIEHHKEKR